MELLFLAESVGAWDISFVESWEVSTTDGRGTTHHLRNTVHLLMPQFAARSAHHALIRVFDAGGNVIETHEQAFIGDNLSPPVVRSAVQGATRFQPAGRTGPRALPA